MHNLWRQCGCLHQGIINTARLKAKYDYKIAIKQIASDFECNNAEELNRDFAERDTQHFWHTWNAKYKKSLSTPVSVAGQTDPNNIANKFRDYYADIYIDSAASKKSVDEYNDLQSTLRSLSDDTQVDIDSIEQSIRLLKLSKAGRT